MPCVLAYEPLQHWMKESDMTALRTDARWHAVVQYRTGTETSKNVEIYLEEIGDIHDHIERGPHWDTVEIVKITRVNHIESPRLHTRRRRRQLMRRRLKPPMRLTARRTTRPLSAHSPPSPISRSLTALPRAAASLCAPENSPARGHGRSSISIYFRSTPVQPGRAESWTSF